MKTWRRRTTNDDSAMPANELENPQKQKAVQPAKSRNSNRCPGTEAIKKISRIKQICYRFLFVPSGNLVKWRQKENWVHWLQTEFTGFTGFLILKKWDSKKDVSKLPVFVGKRIKVSRNLYRDCLARRRKTLSRERNSNQVSTLFRLWHEVTRKRVLVKCVY